MDQTTTKMLVKKILEFPHDYEWSLQGLGMLRLYLDDERRLHIWDDRFAVDNVSVMHTHPWDFKSYVVVGAVVNTRYVPASQGEEYNTQKIFCGAGGGLVGEPYTIKLAQKEPEFYFAGDSYRELADEIHVSAPKRGTITIVKRQFLGDADHANVFWKNGSWVSAEPREATIEEVTEITQTALLTWF